MVRRNLTAEPPLILPGARGDAYGSYGFPQADFDRTQHQRQLLVAVKQRLNWTLVLNPLKNGKIFQAVGKNVKTNVTLGESRSLFKTFNSIPSPQLQSISLRNIGGQNLLAGYTTDNGESALIPTTGIENYQGIQAAVARLDN